ncbi:type II toxin-antitoxin system Phd/YefM family antitoxin [Hydrogenophaga sp. 2FB]|uniref:type II toxin-antitoxin system Phd/YefM family antitoxin n=1 Tax=Hydrogenophaga sp. 2FB TaxID=2502187 RepID=UPI0014853262|nr:type II toxin-antitoxin system Phd/YefM family antitoxin [Hydrogenophaga sp. 2FB]
MSILNDLPQIPATQAKQAFGEMLDRLRTSNAVAITSHGRVKALVSTPEMWSERESQFARDTDLLERKLARAQQSRVELDRLQRHAHLAVDLLSSSADQQALIVSEAKARVARWRGHALCSDDYIDRWNQLLSLPVHELAKEMIGDCGGWGNALRQNTPFSMKKKTTDVAQA